MSLDARQRETLRARIDALGRELHEALAASEAAGQTVELDQTRQGRLSRMDALQGQAMAQASARRARLRLQQLAATAARLDDEDFGLCRDCEEPIAWPRLQLDPCVLRCTRCAGARET